MPTGPGETWTPLGPFDERAGGPRDAVLDGLRAIAALAVAAGHAVLFRFGPLWDGAAPQLRDMVARLTMSGVQMFFLISGYVITRLLLIEHREHGAVSLVKFYKRRVARIVPAFAGYLGGVLLVSHAGYFYVPLRELVAAGAFLCNTSVYPCGWFVGHSWSLAVEEQFYLVWPMLLTILGARRITLFLAAAGTALLVIALHRGASPFASEASFLLIALGALMASSNVLQRLFVTRLSAPAWLGAAAAFVIASRYVTDAAMIVLAPLLLTIVVFGAANVTALAALLKSRPTQFVGGCSYSLYLWQELFLGSRWHYFREPPPLWALPIVVWLSWRFIEKPGIALGRAWTRRPASPQTPERGLS